MIDLREMKNLARISERCELLDRLESEGDQTYRTQLAAMFRTETDAIRLIKHKEFLGGLERTLDACEDVGGRPADHRHQERLRPAVEYRTADPRPRRCRRAGLRLHQRFRDAANAVATVVSTGVLTCHGHRAGRFTELRRALTGTAVAATIGEGLIDPSVVTQVVVLSGALRGRRSEDLLTWYFGIAQSSSHALVGGLVGSGAAARRGTFDLIRQD